MKSNIVYPYQDISLVDMEGEVWKDFPGYEGYYLISDKGRVKSVARKVQRTYAKRSNNYIIIDEFIKKQSLDERQTNPVLFFSASVERSKKNFNVDFAVCLTFKGKFDYKKYKVIHLDNDLKNNRLDNLDIVPRYNLEKDKLIQMADYYPCRNISLEDMEGEIWKEIPGFEEYCMASNMGRIKALERTVYKEAHGQFSIREKIITQNIRLTKKTKIKGNINIQIYFSISIQGVIHQMPVTRAVYSAFSGGVEKNMLVRHYDENPYNNKIENLYLSSHKELTLHNLETGKTTVPDVTKFTDELWKKIKKINSKAVSQYDLEGNLIRTFESMNEAQQNTGVHASSISQVCRGVKKSANGYVWRYVDNAF